MSLTERPARSPTPLLLRAPLPRQAPAPVDAATVASGVVAALVAAVFPLATAGGDTTIAVVIAMITKPNVKLGVHGPPSVVDDPARRTIFAAESIRDTPQFHVSDFQHGHQVTVPVTA